MQIPGRREVPPAQRNARRVRGRSVPSSMWAGACRYLMKALSRGESTGYDLSLKRPRFYLARMYSDCTCHWIAVYDGTPAQAKPEEIRVRSRATTSLLGRGMPVWHSLCCPRKLSSCISPRPIPPQTLGAFHLEIFSSLLSTATEQSKVSCSRPRLRTPPRTSLSHRPQVLRGTRWQACQFPHARLVPGSPSSTARFTVLLCSSLDIALAPGCPTSCCGFSC